MKYICELAHECDSKLCGHEKPHQWRGQSCKGAWCGEKKLTCIEVDPVSDLFDELCEEL